MKYGRERFKTSVDDTGTTHLLAHINVTPLSFLSVSLPLHLHPFLSFLRNDWTRSKDIRRMKSWRKPRTYLLGACAKKRHCFEAACLVEAVAQSPGEEEENSSLSVLLEVSRKEFVADVSKTSVLFASLVHGP